MPAQQRRDAEQHISRGKYGAGRNPAHERVSNFPAIGGLGCDTPSSRVKIKRKPKSNERAGEREALRLVFAGWSEAVGDRGSVVGDGGIDAGSTVDQDAVVDVRQRAKVGTVEAT